MIKLHNTLTRKVEEFKPASAERVTFYSCGPTVYGDIHIGNLRTFVFYDTLRRTLEASGYRVKHVMNITDVGHLVSDADEGEDKLEKGAQREGKSVWEVAEQYIKSFKNDVRLINNLAPNAPSDQAGSYARATDFIDAQIDIIRRLLDKSFAYQTSQAIYFDVTKLPSYGQLTGQKLQDKETAARPEVVVDKDKHHPQDFAVWFFTVGKFSDHAMRWPSPWGEGFPGWHLECSAIIHATLGEPLDIHAGGVDLIGTHHTNEMAQTEAAFGKKLANFWVHSEHLLTDGQKISKSRGNTYTLDDVVKKGFDPLALRLLFLQAHYRTQMNFSWESLQAAQNRLNNWKRAASLRWQTQANAESKMIYGILSELQNDLDTPSVLARIDAVLSTVEDEGLSTIYEPLELLIKEVDALLGINLREPDITAEQKQLIEDRQEARSAKDWQKSDELRDKLKQQGIEISDTEHGPIWSRTQ